ncbi:hypothetical protein [Mucispirillum schaedleri]|uniref:hypothetical protein n=1 Tax=Mucispirillum schaedleri TaxID=248039 RepID=UPI001F5712D5|nr:hypothetical protein [Mucispirillum schaedleri]
MLKYLLIILLLPSYLYAVDCGDGYEWRAKVTEKNFHEYEECMSKAEIKEGKIFTNKTSMDDVHNTYFVSHKQQDECIQLDEYLAEEDPISSGKSFAELIKIKFDKDKAIYDKKAQRYVMEIKSKYIPRQIIFYPNKTIKEIFKLYNKEDSYKLLGGVPGNNTQLIRSWFEPFDYYTCYWSRENKLYEIDGPNDYRVDIMYMEDKTGVYVYQQ